MISSTTFLLRLLVALVLGALVGLERESGDHEAGMRTNALVSLGTALFTLLSAYGFAQFSGFQHMVVDPTRIASYVVAGIGFLGGGIIFLSPQARKVHGLTTAAAVWVVAAIGMACGAGFLFEATATTILALCILVGFRYIERWLWPGRHTRRRLMMVEVDFGKGGSLIGSIHDICLKAGVVIEEISVRAMDERHLDVLEIQCRFVNSRQLTLVLRDISALAGVHAVKADLSR